MIENELLFLGLLKDGPKHGYEIKKIIQEELFPFVAVKIKSIYYPLNKMEKLGLVKKEVGQEGKGPEKYTFRITPKGEEIFEHLITESFLSIERPFFNIDLSLYFLQYVDSHLVKRQLRGRLIFLKRIKRELESIKNTKNASPKHLQVILDHDLDLVNAEIKSITRLKDTLS